MNQLANNIQSEFKSEGYCKKNEVVKSEIKKGFNNKSISLTERDYKVLKFILDMKFSSVDEVHEKFYKKPNSKGEETGTSYVIKRLVKLETAGFLNSTKAFDASKRLFYASLITYKTLKLVHPENVSRPPSKFIDGRTVVHDYYVLLMRLKLESSEKVSNWISDRNLKIESGNFGIQKDTPDGIYTDPEGISHAFELEVTVKAKSRYENKVGNYVSHIRKNINDPKVFKKVHYVAFSKTSYKLLLKHTAIYDNFFKIEMASKYQLMNGLLS